MKLAFRVDSSNFIGMGHIRRCLTLANEAQLLGHTSVFVHSAIDTNSAGMLVKHGHEVLNNSLVPAMTWDLDRNPEWEHQQVIDDERLDADASVAALRNDSPDIVVLDHYFMTQRWVDRMRSAFEADFVALEDLGRQWNQVEYVVNGNLDAQVALTANSQAQTLLGPRYAFLSREYREIRNNGLRPAENRSRVLIFAGGGNTTNLAATFLKIASSTPFGIDVVASSRSANLHELRRRVESCPSATLHLDVPSLAPLYAQARLALGAGGTSSWERACLGVPSIVASVAENQVPVCLSLDRSNLANYVGVASDISEARASEIFHELVNSGQKLREMSRAGMRLVDGFGALRTLCVLAGSSGGGRLRKATAGDAIFLHDWVNDPDVVQNSKTRHVIKWEDHLSWFDSTLLNPDSQLFIFEMSGLPVGQIRFDRRDDRLILTYSIDRDFRSRGLGREIVERGLQRVQTNGANLIEALVRTENIASARVFIKLGFTSAPSASAEFLRFTKEVGS